MTACIVVRHHDRPVSYVALNTDHAERAAQVAALTRAYPGYGYSVAIEQLAP